jgi:hypothetical protein
MMKRHAVEGDRARRTTPTSSSSSSSTRIGVRVFDGSVLVIAARFVGGANVSIACGALES